MIGYAVSRILLMTAVTVQPLVMALAWRHEAPAAYDIMIGIILSVWLLVVVVVIRRAVCGARAAKGQTRREWVDSLRWDEE